MWAWRASWRRPLALTGLIEGVGGEVLGVVERDTVGEKLIEAAR
jgi:hypothetical protein